MKKGFIYKVIRVIVVLSLAVVIAGLLVKLRPKAERQVPTEKGLLVEVLTARAEKIDMIIETYGTVKPREILNLVAEIPGQIVNIHPSFKEGIFIKKGTVLIEIDPRTYQLNLESRRVQIKQAEAELKRLKQEVHNFEASIKISRSNVALAQAEFSRLNRLTGQNVVAQTTRDNAEQRYLTSLERLQGLKNQMALTGPLKERLEAQLHMARVTLRQARLDLERTRIDSPFDGWVLEKTIEEGQHVSAVKHLGKIYRAGALDIEVRIPIKDLKWFPHDLNQGSMPDAEIFFDSKNTSRTWKGRVSRIMAQIDEKTRTLPVVVEVIDNAPAKGDQDIFYLRPGMFVTVQIKGRQVKQAFVLPRHVVHTDGVVYLVRDNRLRIKQVNIMRSFKNFVFIDKGLADGDLVIITPLSGAADGTLVRLKKP